MIMIMIVNERRGLPLRPSPLGQGYTYIISNVHIRRTYANPSIYVYYLECTYVYIYIYNSAEVFHSGSGFGSQKVRQLKATIR